MMSKKRKMDTTCEDRQLHCRCKAANDTTRMMIQCDFCDVWFHPQCVGLDEDEAENISYWNCPGCVEIMSENPALSRKGLLSFQGRSVPKTGWSSELNITEIDESLLDKTIKTKRHRIEGYNLWREGKVVSLASVKTTTYIFFKAECVPAMKDKKYSVHLCLKNGGKDMKWATCSCPAGIDGECKHLVAVVYFVIDLFRQGITKIPDVQTCTDRLQMWHVRKPVTDEPLLFSDISFVKHDPFKVSKKELCSSVLHHNPVPDFAKTLKKTQLEKLVKLYDATKLNLPVMDTIRSNNCQPVLPKVQSTANLDTYLFEKLQATSYNVQLPTMSESVTKFYESTVAVSVKMAQDIEKQTRQQSKNARWFQEREYRITSSMFGTFCRMKPTTDPVKTFIQKKKFFTTKSVRHGINYESQAFARYSMNNCNVDSAVGLVVNPQMSFLGASPDRLVLENEGLKLVEIKCPFSVFERKSTVKKHVLQDSSFFLTEENGQYKLKENHDYNFQIQGQLNVCGIELCDLVVFVPPDDLVVVPVARDRQFFESVMLPKLTNVWFEKLAPYFVNH